MNLSPFGLHPEFCRLLCLTLLHSLWQGALLVVCARLWERWLGERRVNAQHAVNVVALGCLMLAVPVTFVVCRSSSSEPVETAFISPPASQVQHVSAWEPQRIPIAPVALQVPATAPIHSPASSPVILEMPVSVAKSTSNPGTPWLIWLAGAYLTGVAVMLIRLVYAIWRSQRLVAAATPITEGAVLEGLSRRAQEWGAKFRPILARTEETLVPVVAGVLRPAILVPTSALSVLTVSELELVLAHELAHLCRRDLWVQLGQRLAEAMLFFNPSVWMLSRQISLLREYCCDDMTCRSEMNDASSVGLSYAQALLRIVELSRRSPQEGRELVQLAATGGSPSEVRRRIARLCGVPLREPVRLTRGGLAVLVALLGLLAAPGWWSVQAQNPPPSAEEKPAAEAPVTPWPGQFELLVTGPDGKPVPSAKMNVRMTPSPVEEQIIEGKFVSGRRGSMAVTASEAGKLVLKMDQPQRLSIAIIHPGFAPYWAEWVATDAKFSFPHELTAQLDAGWSMGGVIVDDQDRPLAGAAVDLSIRFKKRPGDSGELGVGMNLITGPDGQWRYESVPASLADVHVSVNHPEFRALRKSFPRAGYELQAGQVPHQKIVLDKGLVVTGRVTDEKSQPVAGAVVKTKYLNDLRETKTDENGNYVLGGGEPKTVRIVVIAPGKALDMQEVRVDAGMPPVNFALQSGNKLWLRMVDKEGKPVPRATVFFQRWRGHVDYFEFDHLPRNTDANGVWEWNDAPADALEADLGFGANTMQLSHYPLQARQEGYLIVLPPPLVVTGKVVDAITKEPIPKFTVTPGLRNPEPTIGIDWVRDAGSEGAADGANGAYTMKAQRSALGHIVRIEAPGYRVATSPDFASDAGNVTYDFELMPARDFAAKILTPQGKPAVGAGVVVGGARSQIMLRNGLIDWSSTYADKPRVDETAHFQFPWREEPFQLIITHPEGYWAAGPGVVIPATITLNPWARVDGSFHIAGKPAPGIRLTCEGEQMPGTGDLRSFWPQNEVTTGADGRFVFERLFPGHLRIGRNITFMVRDGATEVTSSAMMPVTAVAGQTATLNLGREGRPVLGKLLPPPNAPDPVPWRTLHLALRAASLQPPPQPVPPAEVQGDEVKLREWWSQSEEMRNWLAVVDALRQVEGQMPYFRASIDKDGTFRIEDVAPGEYVVDANFMERGPGRIRGMPVTIPAPAGEGGAREPVQLGELQLE